MMIARAWLPWCCTLALLTTTRFAPAAESQLGVRTERNGDELVLLDGDRPIARLVLRDPVVRRPYLADVRTPGGIQVTRRHPPVAGEDAVDHDTMHPGLWFALGDLNGEDFWRNKAEIRPVGDVPDAGVYDDGLVALHGEAKLLRADGRALGRQSFELEVRRVPQGYLYSWQFTLGGDDEALDFGVQEEMGFGARLATPLVEKAGGVVTSADGRTGAKKIWGTRDKWCDYSGTIDGKYVGITIMPHPQNPRPTWWHTRDYGVFVANGFGPRSVDEGAEPRLKVPAGESITFRYGVLVHESPTDQRPDLEAVYRRYTTLVDSLSPTGGGAAK